MSIEMNAAPSKLAGYRTPLYMRSTSSSLSGLYNCFSLIYNMFKRSVEIVCISVWQEG